MVIPGAKYTRTAEQITLYGENITPTMGGNKRSTISVSSPGGLFPLSVFLGIFAYSSFWSIGEVFKQRERVRKGWFPMNPKRKNEY